MAITKTSFMRGIQCPKMLWLDRHKPSLQIIPEEVQERLDAGNDFGDEAMAMFGPYEEMTIYRPGTTIPDKKKMAEKTKEHLSLGTPVICEAAFLDYNNYCAVDILKKEGDHYDIYEVKNTNELHDQFIRDAGFQYYIVSRNHLKIDKIYIVLHGEEEKFHPVEITDEAKKLYPWINENIWRLNRLQKEKEELDTLPGPQCCEPYECWYYQYCHKVQEEDTVTETEDEQLRLL